MCEFRNTGREETGFEGHHLLQELAQNRLCHVRSPKFRRLAASELVVLSFERAMLCVDSGTQGERRLVSRVITCYRNWHRIDCVM